MAQFKQWALQYVLSDDQSAQLEITQKAAKEIENSRASSTVVGNWAASVHQWMASANSNDDDDQMDDGDDGGSGDIISRAKGSAWLIAALHLALDFLAGTLEALDRTVLRPDQVLRLIGFFGAMFSYDHKAGITASAKALRQLYSMKSFKPDMGIKIFEDVCKIKEDFRLQTAITRLEIYELFLSLVQDPAVSSELLHKYGASCGFAVDLLQLCSNERDPRNLMIWFKIIKILLNEYSPSAEVTEELFKIYSAYFPISLRSSATPIGITADDLKNVLRGCFSAHQRVAPFAFPFLMQKLDQGDAIKAAVKVDILKTIQECIEKYENPQVSVVPYIEKIWASLKYEVRNGEVKETIDATLEVLRAIARKLDGSKTQKLDASLLKDYIDLVFRDCRDDLSNPTYTKQAGLLLMTVITASVRGYVLYNANFIETIRQNLRQPKSPSHTRDLFLLLNSILKTRIDLIKNRKDGHPDDEDQLKGETTSHLDSLFNHVYLPVWTGKVNEPGSEEKDVLKQVAQGLALLVRQRVLDQDGETSLLCPATVCSEICSLFTVTLTRGLTLSSNDNPTHATALEDEVVLALRTIVMNYTDGFTEFVGAAKAGITKRDWSNPSSYSLGALKDLLSRVVFIGCSEIPSKVKTDAPLRQPYSPLQHYITSIATLLDLFPLSPSPSTANSHILSSFHASILWFDDACEAKFKKDTLAKYSTSEKNWDGEYIGLPEDWVQQLARGDLSIDEAIGALEENEPEVYRQYLRLSLFAVRHLYRSAAERLAPWPEEALAQLAQTAALVVRSLDDKLQTSCNLAHHAFDYFDAPESTSKDPVLGLLTVGILQGLRPGAMTGLYKPQGVAERFLCNTSELGLSSRISDIRAAIGIILSNKYKGGANTGDPESSTLTRILRFWSDWIKSSVASSEVNPDTFRALNNVAMHMIAGAVARQDRAAVELISILHEAAASSHINGEIFARSVGILVQPNELLTSENHAVVKRFYKQWAYGQLAKPLYELARPSGEDNAESRARYSVMILSIVRNCPFTVYQDDLEPLIRLLVTALSNSSAGGKLSEEVAYSQAISALEILVEILANEADALKGYLREIIGGATKAYQESAPKHTLTETVKPVTRTVCRKLALQVLGVLPKTFEERYILTYVPQTQRMLALACGDPVRRVREAARLARANWTSVA
ncbi:Dos2-interacting transcription regulator of RNA-Pol-II-domain-containing protein [Podospora australis]|uniref:MMS19 nucleotide excision repair protein n=1 Tax=Podospora australis TaxID=1536484 RepID=A0AAN7AJQ3_9PEZI|nr:Dos2-interacting transcription regulator of RNA-Pol-II-domain-containing protein [Podospora australis]